MSKYVAKKFNLSTRIFCTHVTEKKTKCPPKYSVDCFADPHDKAYTCPICVNIFPAKHVFLWKAINVGGAMNITNTLW